MIWADRDDFSRISLMRSPLCCAVVQEVSNERVNIHYDVTAACRSRTGPVSHMSDCFLHRVYRQRKYRFDAAVAVTMAVQ